MTGLGRREFLQVTGAASLGLAAKDMASSTQTNRPNNPGDPWIEINLSHIAWNLAQIKKRVENRPVMAVIKANAYGHGLIKVGQFLEKLNIDFLAVGKFEEAYLLRESGVKTPILNLGPFSEYEAHEIVRLGISQSIYADDYSLLARSAISQGKAAKVHLKLDTGLGRVGVPYYKASGLIERIAGQESIHIEGVFTPFTEDEQFDETQLQRFREVCDDAKNRGFSLGLRHAASSAGILSFQESYLDMVRPGITLYGHYPSTKEFEAKKVELRPAMSLKARVIYVKDLRPGDSVSYHQDYIATEETRVATIYVGYSDGYPYSSAGKANVLINGEIYPSIALVTSNHMTVRVQPDKPIEIGDEVVLLGNQGKNEINGEELAAWSGTSVYKILILMNPLLPRVYLEA